MESDHKTMLESAMSASRTEGDAYERYVHLRQTVGMIADLQRGESAAVLNRALSQSRLHNPQSADAMRLRESMCRLRVAVHAWQQRRKQGK